MGVVNLKWHDAMTEVGQFFTTEERTAGWPDSMKSDQLAALQRPYRQGDTLQAGKTTALLSGIESSILSGALPHSTTVERRHRGRPDSAGGDFTALLRYALQDNSYEVPVHHLKANDFAAWLVVQGEQPSAHFAAWLEAAVLLDLQGAPVVAVGASGGVEAAKKVKKKTPIQLNASRYQMCIDAGLTMPDNDYANLPTGIGELAKQESVSKQAFSKSVKKHISTISR